MPYAICYAMHKAMNSDVAFMLITFCLKFPNFNIKGPCILNQGRTFHQPSTSIHNIAHHVKNWTFFNHLLIRHIISSFHPFHGAIYWKTSSFPIANARQDSY
jgi:hypothetical protein